MLLFNRLLLLLLLFLPSRLGWSKWGWRCFVEHCSEQTSNLDFRCRSPFFLLSLGAPFTSFPPTPSTATTTRWHATRQYRIQYWFVHLTSPKIPVSLSLSINSNKKWYLPNIPIYIYLFIYVYILYRPMFCSDWFIYLPLLQCHRHPQQQWNPTILLWSSSSSSHPHLIHLLRPTHHRTKRHVLAAFL